MAKITFKKADRAIARAEFIDAFTARGCTFRVMHYDDEPEGVSGKLLTDAGEVLFSVTLEPEGSFLHFRVPKTGHALWFAGGVARQWGGLSYRPQDWTGEWSWYGDTLADFRRILAEALEELEKVDVISKQVDTLANPV